MNVLVIAPHPDDEVIGCGGTLCLHADRGDRISVAFLTSGELGLKHLPREEAWRIREGEAEEAASMIGIGDLHFLRFPDWFLGDHIPAVGSALKSICDREMPELVFVPHLEEWHPDHKAVVPAIQYACNNISGQAPEVFTYEVWTPLQSFDHVRNISAVMGKKLDALRCYRSQLRGFEYDRAVDGLNQYRGALAAKCQYAEVFGAINPGTIIE
jgi:LmbE family N-acetylglucosaminyl deacetylase